MIRPQLRTASAAPATLVSLARVGIAGLSMASLLDAEAAVSAAPTTVPDSAAPSLSTDLTVQRVRASV
ncbi:hypothetical protein [Sanguibacter suarezii]|uniref:hypothetical protein n=1 Tax=Sanguibacter suarezii TaxID=60921 RepID=UPI00083378EA|nr:hypothetical protein [Sanguibacter suarezii]